jgi:hypothetical protein
VQTAKATVAALGEATMRGRGVQLRQFCFQMFVDEQQRLQRTAQIAATIGHDLVDGCIIGSETHRNPLPLITLRDKLWRPIRISCG